MVNNWLGLGGFWEFGARGTEAAQATFLVPAVVEPIRFALVDVENIADTEAKCLTLNGELDFASQTQIHPVVLRTLALRSLNTDGQHDLGE